MSKNLVVIGSTGDGKSKFLCCASKSKEFEERLSALSVTKLAETKRLNWRNSASQISCTDTQGLHDSQGNDSTHVANMVNAIKQVGHINMISLIINGTNPRLSAFTKETIKLFLNIFGVPFFNNLVIIFTFWNLNERGDDDENRLTREYNEHLQTLGCTKRVPCFFVDSNFDQKNIRGFYSYAPEVQEIYEARFQNILGTLLSFDDLSVEKIQPKLTERESLKTEVQNLQKQLEKKTYSGFGSSSAPFGTRYALGVFNGWTAGTASECIIPSGWRLVSGNTICYAHGKCPQGNPYGNAGNLSYNFTIERVA